MMAQEMFDMEALIAELHHSPPHGKDHITKEDRLQVKYGVCTSGVNGIVLHLFTKKHMCNCVMLTPSTILMDMMEDGHMGLLVAFRVANDTASKILHSALLLELWVGVARHISIRKRRRSHSGGDAM